MAKVSLTVSPCLTLLFPGCMLPVLGATAGNQAEFDCTPNQKSQSISISYGQWCPVQMQLSEIEAVFEQQQPNALYLLIFFGWLSCQTVHPRHVKPL